MTEKLEARIQNLEKQLQKQQEQLTKQFETLQLILNIFVLSKNNIDEISFNNIQKNLLTILNENSIKSSPLNSSTNISSSSSLSQPVPTSSSIQRQNSPTTSQAITLRQSRTPPLEANPTTSSIIPLSSDAESSSKKTSLREFTVRQKRKRAILKTKELCRTLPYFIKPKPLDYDSESSQSKKRKRQPSVCIPIISSRLFFSRFCLRLQLVKNAL